MSNTFSGWGAVALPIEGEVAIVDEGDRPAVGLSAMQMDNLQVGRGVLVLEHNGKTARAYVWNAYGPDSTRERHLVRITKGLSDALGCEAGDLITFTQVEKQIRPVRVEIFD